VNVLVHKRKSFDEWHAERVAKDPNFDRVTDRLLARRGPPRKIPMLCDESLEHELVADLRTIRDFRIVRLPKGSTDRAVWQRARRDRLVILTADEDFWDDRRYPLHLSPGVVILRGRNVEERTTALARLSVVWDLPRNYSRFAHAFFAESKTRASPTHIQHKFSDEGSVVDAEWR
jgi:predicted nuclease of predicted toxin-antitoxin system